MENIIDERIKQLTAALVAFPFIGLLLRTYLVAPSLTDEQIFQKTLKSYNINPTVINKYEIEKSYEMFQNMSQDARNAYMTLYRIISYGMS